MTKLWLSMLSLRNLGSNNISLTSSPLSQVTLVQDNIVPSKKNDLDLQKIDVILATVLSRPRTTYECR
jgi:hypothetical protein